MSSEVTDFKSLNLPAPLQRAIDKLGYTKPSPIQARAIPHVLEGRDVMGIAQTGTGKTAAFALPVLSHILGDPIDPPKRGARVLVLSPTRELASQIAESFREYGCYMDDLSVVTVFGGVPLPGQIKRLVPGNDILVATPGRLIDLLDRKAITLRDVEFLVLDEADQMLDMGFIHALKRIVKVLPENRQTLFFSATMAKNIETLSKQYLTMPIKVSVTPPNSTADKVEQSVIFVNQGEKLDLLGITLLQDDVDRALVFTRTKHGANKVVKKLAQIGIASLAIHGNKSQSQRQKALAAFRDGEIKVLIATDVAARGIDIEGISHVINYEIPNVPEQYVHRIGRTARANRRGEAIAFVDKDERSYLKDIQKLLKTTIPVAQLPDDFLGKGRALKSRTPIIIEQPAGNAPRKGRGKSRNKKKPSGRGEGGNRQQGGNRGSGGSSEGGHRSKNKSRNNSGDGSSNSNRNNGERGRVTPKSSSNGGQTASQSAGQGSGQGRSQNKGGNSSGRAKAKPSRANRTRQKAPTRNG